MSQTKTTPAALRGQHSQSLLTPRVAARPETKFPVTEVSSFDDEYLTEDDPKSSSLSKEIAPHIVLSQLPVEMQRRCLSLTSSGALTKLGPKAKGASGHGWDDYSLRIILAGAVTTSAGGIVANVYSADPTVLSISEWSNFATLFDEVKLQSFELSVCPYSGQSAPAITSIAIGSFLNKGATPASILSVLVAPDGKLLSPNMVVPSGVHMKAPSLGFAPTTSPAGTTAYGCPGYVHLYATGVASTAIMTYVIMARYHLRGRM